MTRYIFFYINYTFLIYNSEIETLKVVKTQNQSFQTSSDSKHFKAALYETETMILLELPSLAPSIKNVSDTQVKVRMTLKLYSIKKTQSPLWKQNLVM